MGDENISDQREESGVTNQDCQSLDLEALQATSELKKSIMEDKGSASIFSKEIVGRDQHNWLVVGEEEEEILGRDEGLQSEELNAKFLKGKMVVSKEVTGWSEEIMFRGQHTRLVVGEEEEESLDRDEGLKSEEYDALNAKFLKGKMVVPKEVNGWGTTNLTFIGEDTIFVGVDSRGTAYNTNAFILTERAKKLFKIQYNIVATISGDSDLCEEMITYVKDRMENAMDIDGGVAGDIHRAATLAHEYIRTWKSEFKISFNGSCLIIGWENNNESFRPYIYLVNNGQFIYSSTLFEAHQNGTGGHFAHPYYTYHRKGSSREELLELLKQSLLYAAINDPWSGGLLRVTEVRPFGYTKIYSHRVLEVFFDHYDAMAKYLPCMLVSLWYNCDYEYTKEHNEKVDPVLGGFFGDDYYRSVVLGINRKFVVRLLHFNCPVHATYEQLKEFNACWVRDYEMNSRPKPRHTYDRTVPLEVRELPWILISGFDSPIVFGEPTRTLVKLLQDV